MISTDLNGLTMKTTEEISQNYCQNGAKFIPDEIDMNRDVVIKSRIMYSLSEVLVLISQRSKLSPSGL